MARGFTASVNSEIVNDNIRPLFLTKLEFEAQTLYLSSSFEVTYDSNLYLNNGWFRGPSQIQEASDTRAEGFTIELSGISASLMSLVLSGSDHTKTGSLYLAFLNSSLALVTDPYLLAWGNLDTIKIIDNEKESGCILTYEGEEINLNKAIEHRYTHESQRAFFPTDKGFEYVAGLQQWKGFWGVSKNV